MMLAPTMSGAASAATVHPKAKPSAATYCKAAKSWLAFENATLAAGPYDTLWYETTGELMTKLKAAAPKPIQSATRYLGYWLVTTRADLVSGLDGAVEERVEALVSDGLVLSAAGSGVTAARDAVGAYARKNCKIDVLEPFRKFAEQNH